MVGNEQQTAARVRPILCAIDESAPSHVALDAAASLATRLGEPLHLVHVWVGETATFAEHEARQFLDDAACNAHAKRTHFEISATTVDGIVAAAERVSPELVIMGTHSRGRVGRLLLGSTADNVLRCLRWPLLVVRRETSWPPARIVVGDDGSEAAARAAHIAAAISSAYRVRMTLLHAVPEVLTVTGRSPRDARRATVMINRAQGQLQQRASVVAAEGGVAIRTTLHATRPEHALASAGKADGATLLVVGHRSTLQLSEPEHPSVAEALIRTGHAAVLVYPEIAAELETSVIPQT